MLGPGGKGGPKRVLGGPLVGFQNSGGSLPRGPLGFWGPVSPFAPPKNPGGRFSPSDLFQLKILQKGEPESDLRGGKLLFWGKILKGRNKNCLWRPRPKTWGAGGGKILHPTLPGGRGKGLKFPPG